MDTCYQQAAGLALMVEDNLDLFLLVEFIKSVADYIALFEKFQDIEDPETHELMLAQGCIEQKKDKRKITTGDFFIVFEFHRSNAVVQNISNVNKSKGFRDY